jgi:phosphoenolpyruvate-protein phosphotransferase/dihydroxyacetone kinase phosphotransfer subunit
MIGFVIVSHSAKLAEGVCELAGQVAQGRVRLAPAGGTEDPENPIGTDAFKVLQAIESVYSDGGVAVLTDLGSAVLSAETALELLPEERRARVRLCQGPLVEGAVAAASLAAAGASLEEIAQEVQGAGGERAIPAPQVVADRKVRIVNPLGLHARPAARLVRLARRFEARVTIENLTRPAGPAEAGSMNGVLGLGARRGDELLLRAHGRDAQVALRELVRFFEDGCGETTTTPTAAPAVRSAQDQLVGLPASAGIAIGPLARFRPVFPTAALRVVEDPEAERRRLHKALEEAREETRALYEWARAKAGEDEAGIFDAQLLFLEDAELRGAADRLVEEERISAEAAWERAAREFAGRLEALDDAYLRARAADVADVAWRVIRRLSGAGAVRVIEKPSILAVRDLAPSEVKDLDPERILGLCLESGSASAHSVILARAMGIPVVAGLGPALAGVVEGTTVALDGERGTVWVAPDAEQLSVLEHQRQEWLAARAAAQARRRRPAATRDGRRIRVFANINSAEEAAEAVDHGAEGVGVLRTEFLFLGRREAPSEEEQAAAYRAIAKALDGRPLVIRTLDVGGDKRLSYIETGEEPNPFLGLRGIRLTLARRDLLRAQLRAILRAAAEYPVEVLLPMISSLNELRQVKAELEQLQGNAKVGVMIEVPAAVAVADRLACEAAFFSIGTNDLVQYAMAADRTNPRVASLADPFQPALLRMVRDTVRAGRRAGIGVTLCGELAADPLATPLLIGMGIEEFSVSAPLIPDVKHAIARTSAEEAGRIADEALALDSADAVRQLLSNPLR